MMITYTSVGPFHYAKVFFCVNTNCIAELTPPPLHVVRPENYTSKVKL